MLSMPETDVSKFVASVALVVGFLFDDGHQRFVDVCKSLKKQRLTPQEHYFMEHQKEGSTNAFATSRGCLFLLWKLCLDTKMAAIMGGTIEAAKDLAAMISHVLELTVEADGGLLVEIDTVTLPYRSVEILKLVENDGLEASALRQMVSTLVSHRRSVKKEYGLDANCMVHTLLALATRCYKECLKTYAVSALVEALAGQDDCDVDMLRQLVQRHVAGGPKLNSVEENVLLRDGYVGADVWMIETSSDESTATGQDEQRRSRAAKDHILAEEIQSHVRRESILEFIEAVATAKKANDANSEFVTVDSKSALNQLLAVTVLGQDKNYTDSLSEWVVSSDPFASKSMNGSLSHAFDHSLKGHTSTAPGKVMVKEARKCHKNIPQPHPNSSIFVCFAEERMDICRCLITGPVDTPYAFGAFEFDVFFPSSYPTIPPLVQFMTTGS
jgi:Ubiquitin-conjugating enzyme